jgi:outer membrane protein
MQKPLVLLLFAALAAPLSAPAQTVPQRLTLEDALSIARQHNPALRKARADQGVNESATLQAWGRLLPQLTLSTRSSLGSNTTLTGQDAFGRPVSLDEAEHYRSSSASQNASLSVTLFDGGNSLRSIGAARSREEAGAVRILAEEQRLLANVTRAYYRALSTERRVDLEARLLESAEDHLSRTEELLRIAVTSHPDVLGARGQVALARQNLGRAEADAAKAKLALLEQLGVGGRDDYTLAAELPAAFDPAQLDVESIVASAVGNSPGVRQARAQTAAARQQTSAARGSRWPRITADAGFGRSMSLRSFDAFGQINPQNRGLTLAVGASLPVFTGFQTRHSITQAWTAEQNALEDERAAALAAEREVRSSFIDLEEAYAALQLAQLRAELESERLAMAEELYRIGSYTFITLQQHIEQAAQAERSALDALFTFADARVTLEERAAMQVGS